MDGMVKEGHGEGRVGIRGVGEDVLCSFRQWEGGGKRVQ